MQHIDREKAQRLIERMEALAKEENVSIQKIAECGQIVLRREKRHQATDVWRNQQNMDFRQEDDLLQLLQ
ncbi:hypothetical protein FQJ73_16600 [Escherichia coli]|nr:hypothetical protein [Escherichia coli]